MTADAAGAFGRQRELLGRPFVRLAWSMDTRTPVQGRRSECTHADFLRPPVRDMLPRMHVRHEFL